MAKVINLDMITPTIKVSTKKDIILITSPMMLLFPDGLTIPVMTASKIIPSTSSIIAALSMERPSLLLNFCISLKTDTEILTEVAVKMVPI